MAALLFMTMASGCVGVAYIQPDKLPYAKLRVPYDRTRIRTSTTLDVLNIARDRAYQFDPDDAEPVLLTQSDTVVAYSGRSKDGLKSWLDMIVFDEYRMTATRKYFFCTDERATTARGQSEYPLFPPRKGLMFESEFTVDPEVLTTPYATEEAQKIAVLKWLARQFDVDLTALTGGAKHPTQGNEVLQVCGLMIRQMFQSILVELGQSPDVAKNLADDRGIPFPHPSLKEGRVRLIVGTDIALMAVRVNLPMSPLETQ